MADQFIYHSGGVGDITYSLPAIKKIGGGILVCGDPMWKYQYAKPLFESQSFIKEVRHISETDLPKGFINLDFFRGLWDGKTHIVNLHLRYLGFPDYDFNSGGWLETDKLPDISSDMRLQEPYGIVNITPRYRDRFFKWHHTWGGEVCDMIMQSWTMRKAFYIGTKEEYEKVQAKKIEWGMVNEHRLRFFKTRDALHAAAVIKGAEMFTGNQSAMLAIRQSLGLPYRFEQAPFHVDTTQHSKHEKIINPITRRLHIFCYSLKKAFT